MLFRSGAYGVSKAAITSFMSILADEMDTDKRVKVNAINPEPVKTGMRMKAFPGEDPNTLKNPDAIMSTYLYLMSKDCSKTGQIFHTQN